MTDASPPPVPLRKPPVAVLLALVLPGLGHFYQRRFLKSAIFFVGVMGLFGWGMATAEGHGVYFRPPTGSAAPGAARTHNMKEFIGYVAQAGVGVATWPAVVQHRRYYDSSNAPPRAMREPLSGAFDGVLRSEVDGRDLMVTGTLDLVPVDQGFGETLEGTFSGTTDAGEAITVRLGDRVEVDPKVAASKARGFEASVLDEQGDVVGFVSGAVARPLVDWYAVPPGPDEERLLNEEFGTRYDLTYVIVMIAGLLNFLAAYDAFEGPALGVAPRVVTEGASG